MGPDLFRSVSVLGCGSSLVGGRVHFGSLLLKTNHINTKIFVEILGRFSREGNSFDTEICMEFSLSRWLLGRVSVILIEG